MDELRYALASVKYMHTEYAVYVSIFILITLFIYLIKNRQRKRQQLLYYKYSV